MPTVEKNDIALCLSGGGFRAALFHLGAVRRLNELGVLSQLDAITSVSGGSILNGILAMNWGRLAVGRGGELKGFDECVAEPLRKFCGRDLRTPLLIGSRLNPLNWPGMARNWLSVSGNQLAKSYEGLFAGRLLADVPISSGQGAPRFVFCATSMNTGACWHFHAGPTGIMGDFYFGYLPTNGVKISEAVAASSAFPFAIAPLRLEIDRDAKIDRIDQWGRNRVISEKRKNVFKDGDKTVSLTDGGVYDNLGVEPVWDRFENLLISDAGRPFTSAQSSSPFIVSRLGRAAAISGEQVGAVRKRWIVERFKAKPGTGTLWGIDTRIENYQLADAKGYGETARQLFSQIRTDLNAFTESEMDCIENHGYSLADAAMRSHGRKFCASPSAEFRWPRPAMANDQSAAATLAKSSEISPLEDMLKILNGKQSDEYL
jgi:NTE family protein